jgi:hypothetical protein
MHGKACMLGPPQDFWLLAGLQKGPCPVHACPHRLRRAPVVFLPLSRPLRSPTQSASMGLTISKLLSRLIAKKEMRILMVRAL